MTEQTLVEPKTEELAVFSPVEATIAEAKAENEKMVFDYETPQGEKEARSHIAKLRKVKTKISDVHKEAKAESRAFGLRLDAKKNELTGEVDGMIAVHKEPLDKIAAEKQAVIDAEKRKAEEEEAQRVAEIEAREAAVREKERAIIEAEEKIAREKAEVELKEKMRKIAEDAAIGARERAEEKAKAEADAKELAEKRRKEAEEAAWQKRIANKKHRKQVWDDIHCSLAELGIDIYDCDTLLKALKENRIPHVSINY